MMFHNAGEACGDARRSGAQWKSTAGWLAVSVLWFSAVGVAQYDQNRDRGRYNDRVTTLVPGTVIPVRTNEAIDVAKGDYRVYTGIVDQDVRGNDGRLAIQRGSNVELIVRFARDNDLILDLDSVTTNGQRYAVRADTKRVDSQLPNDGIVGAIFGAINGGQVRGQAVRVPRNTVVTFRLQRPLDVGIADRGVTRNGWHYHDYDRDGYGYYNGPNPNNYNNQNPDNYRR